MDVSRIWRLISSAARVTAGRFERQPLPCSHPFDQVQGSKSITQGRMIPPRQLLGTVSSASLGRLPNKPSKLAHRALPLWELTGQSPPRTEVPYCCVPYPPVVRSVKNYDPLLL